MSQGQSRRIFAKFTGAEILLEQGRLLFSLLHALVRGGYVISLFDNHPPETLGKYGSLRAWHAGSDLDRCAAGQHP